MCNNFAGSNSVAEVQARCNPAVFEYSVINIVSIYLNPVSEILQINASEGITVQGATVYSLLVEQLFETSEKNIDVSGLSEGIYFIEISTYQGKLVKKIIKEKDKYVGLIQF